MNKKAKLLIRTLSIVLLSVIAFPKFSVEAEVSTSQTTPETSSFQSAAEAVTDMGVGWNLGNTLDSCDYKVYDIENEMMKKDKYQMKAYYQTKPFSAGDFSTASNFSTSINECTLKWKITKLNSSLSGVSNRFLIQIINSNIGNTGNNMVKFKITKAEFVTAGGKVIKLSDMINTYSMKIESGKTTFVVGDLAKKTDLSKASKLIGGTLTITASITEYPKPVNPISNETYYETLWGNLVTTEAMIKKVKEAGFNAVRLPITYFDHMDKNGNIDKDWLNRVKQIVDYVVNNEMYCIINLHHDTGKTAWIKADAASFDLTSIKFEKVWKQIATKFIDYDEKLLFEGFNEILNNANQWSAAGAEAYEVTNALNQVFVNTIRATGGKNANRNLVVTTYAAGADVDILAAFVLPKDSVKNHLLAEVHTYAPLEFSWNQDSVYWAKTRSTWDEQKDELEVSKFFERLNTYFVQKEIPVIIGEFGAWNKNNTMDRIKYVDCYLDNAEKYNITCFWWDNGGGFDLASTVTTGALLNRKNNTWYYPELMEHFK